MFWKYVCSLCISRKAEVNTGKVERIFNGKFFVGVHVYSQRSLEVSSYLLYTRIVDSYLRKTFITNETFRRCCLYESIYIWKHIHHCPYNNVPSQPRISCLANIIITSTRRCFFVSFCFGAQNKLTEKNVDIISCRVYTKAQRRFGRTLQLQF